MSLRDDTLGRVILIIDANSVSVNVLFLVKMYQYRITQDALLFSIEILVYALRAKLSIV